MKTEAIGQGRVKKKEVAVGAGALILLLLVAFAFAKKKEYECRYCDATFKTKAELIAHIEAEHPAEIKTIYEIADEVNRELGGSYVAGVLTPPAWWTGSVTEWSRHVQAIAWERYYQQFAPTP